MWHFLPNIRYLDKPEHCCFFLADLSHTFLLFPILPLLAFSHLHLYLFFMAHILALGIHAIKSLRAPLCLYQGSSKRVQTLKKKIWCSMVGILCPKAKTTLLPAWRGGLVAKPELGWSQKNREPDRQGSIPQEIERQEGWVVTEMTGN